MKMGSNFRFLSLCLLALIASTHAQLQLGFYAKSCPNAEQIVLKFVHDHIHNAPSLAAALIRMHFHDCFVRGCDASVLLNSTTNQAEKNAPPNLTVRGFDFIDRIKSLVEAECPGVVSCADILTLSARDTIVATGGPFWKVPTGRRDGVISNLTEARDNIPAPSSNFTTLQTLFANQGLDLKDLVLLSGAHTIGIAHCSSLSNRLFNFTGKGDQDPSLDSEYAANLKAFKCTDLNKLNTTKIEMDPGSRKTFDLSYYSHVIKRRGLFESDAALLTNSVTKAQIIELLEGSVENFFAEFATSMEKMGRINVKTGTEGEIRKHCAMIGAQALVAIPQSNGSPRAYASSITSTSTTLEEGAISYPLSGLSATFENNEVTIFATLTLPNGTTSFVHVWQDGPLSGTTPREHSHETSHQNSKEILDLLSGSSTQPTGNSRQRRRNTHGVLNAVSWGILMPTGAIIARYLKVFKSADPTWFYLHITCQASAYIVGVSGLGTGLKLGSDSEGVDYDTHRALGIVLVCLGTLQVFALFLRPNKDHKYRVYWNVYHHLVGYATIIISVVNIFEGFETIEKYVGDRYNSWKHAYIGIIGALAGIAVFLEAFTWIIVFKRRKSENKIPHGANGANGYGSRPQQV